MIRNIQGKSGSKINISLLSKAHNRGCILFKINAFNLKQNIYLNCSIINHLHQIEVKVM